MHTIRRLSLFTAAALCAAAGLAQPVIIDSLYIAGEANLNLRAGSSSGPVLADEHSLQDQTGTGPGPAMPLVASGDVAFGTAFATGRQDPFGTNMARMFAHNNQPGGGLHVSMYGNAYYELTVSTATPDTPLVLSFHTFASSYLGSMYYAGGALDVGLYAMISTARNGGGPVDVWGIDERSSLNAGTWSRSVRTVDAQSIGLPTATVTSGWTDFRSQSGASYDPFAGTLDFGLLQPGETFTLIYELDVFATGTMQYFGSTVAASFVDPFGLGGPQPVVLQGVDYSLITVPEPATWAAWLGGAGLIVALWRRRAAGRRG